MRSNKPLILSTLTLLGAASDADADAWKHRLTPYLWGAGISGTTSVGPITSDVDVGFSDIISNLKIGGMLTYRGDHERLAIMVDLIYVDLEGDKSSAAGPLQIDATAKLRETIFEADVGYHLTERTVGFVGLRYNDISPDIAVTTTGPGSGVTLSGSGSESWIDPLIGISTEIPLSERWSFALRGDVGGFGIGSDFAWQAVAAVRWQAGKTMSVVGGYRYLSADYQNGSGASLFKYDMSMSGPALGVAFAF
ncbi:MAG TPA: hypothetical protein VE046_00050 [Steroidobacteraceae bacterium]|nr:hypothetical protein [Steroidobacteraceae bacterium]